MAVNQSRAKLLWVIAELNGQLFGFHCLDVREMLIVPQTTAVPGAPEYVRGIINLRGKALPVVDLRKRMKLPSALDAMNALCAMLDQRAEDHRRWLDELESSIQEHRPFTLAIDPHQCAFGKWYDNFKTDSVVLSGLLKRFDLPHQRLHALAGEAAALQAANQIDQARRLLADARGGLLQRMVSLFEEAKTVVHDSQREIAVVLEGTRTAFAACVDSIVAVEQLAEGSLSAMEHERLGAEDSVLAGTARRIKTNEVLMTLNTDRILDFEVETLLPAHQLTAASPLH